MSRARANISSGLELLSSLRLCSNVPGQWAVQTALGGYQSIRELTRPGGRLYESRQAIIDGVARSKYLQLARPMGALYAFVEVRSDVLPDFDDQAFALDLLENKHVLVAPGRELQRAVSQLLPHHQSAGAADSRDGVSSASKSCSKRKPQPRPGAAVGRLHRQGPER